MSEVEVLAGPCTLQKTPGGNLSLLFLASDASWHSLAYVSINPVSTSLFTVSALPPLNVFVFV